MKVDLRTPPSRPVAEMVDFARRCEEAGFWGCGFNDAQMHYRDTYVVMAAVLAATSSLRVHPALTCPGLRHASVIANLAKTLQEIGPGRFELWLGRGAAAPQTVGLPQLKPREMRETIVEIQRTMAGESGVFGTGSEMYIGGGEKVPVFLASRGPQGAKLAGELCDGVLLGVPPTAEGLAMGKGWIAEGAARSGRDLSEVEIVPELRCVVRETKEEAQRAWSPHLLAILAAPTAEQWLRERGIEYDITGLQPKVREAYQGMQKLYPSPHIAEDWDAAMTLADVIPGDLKAAMSDAMAAVGDPDDVARRIGELEALGVQRLYLMPALTFQLPEEELKGFQEVIGSAVEATVS